MVGRFSKAGTAGFLGRLRRDVRGNTLVIVTIALFPIVGMLGGALDASRAYLVKSRLQHACDASALAGRRSMEGGSWGSANETVARNFFNANFTDERYGSGTPTVNYAVGNDQIVRATANVDVPMTLMRLFGTETVPLSVTCNAELQLPNSDIMFVLDTTLSMLETNPSDTQNRLAILREQVINFHTTLEAAKSGGTQVRYGFVPYSNTVNVGMLLRHEWMADTWRYQSRTMNPTPFTVPGSTDTNRYRTRNGTVTTTGTRTTTTQPGRAEACVAPPNEGYSDVTTNGAWTPNATAVPRQRQVVRVINGITYTASLSGTVCTITKITHNNYRQEYTSYYEENPNYGNTSASTQQYRWTYGPRDVPEITQLKGTAINGLMAGGSFVLQNFENVSGANPGTLRPRTITWNATNACIEERDTVVATNYATRPALAHDLDVDTVPNAANPATQWRPYIPSLVFARAVTNYAPMNPTTFRGPTVTDVTATNYINLKDYPSLQAACPSPARKLAEMDGAAVQTYVTGLAARGRTYHDIGFLWGLRLLSAQGIFGAENIAAGNGSAISRHLIFMTDGRTETNYADYDAYGLSAIDRRRTVSTRLPNQTDNETNEINPIVEARLQHLCSVAKTQKNITVWVIAFGTTLTTNLTNCASPNRAFQANNAAELTATFADIAAQIAQLRITR